MSVVRSDSTILYLYLFVPIVILSKFVAFKSDKLWLSFEDARKIASKAKESPIALVPTWVMIGKDNTAKPIITIEKISSINVKADFLMVFI